MNWKEAQHAMVDGHEVRTIRKNINYRYRLIDTTFKWVRGNDYFYACPEEDSTFEIVEIVEKEILVPDEIEIYWGGIGDGFGIGFGENQILHTNGNPYCVTYDMGRSRIKTKLIPVKKEDLKKGYTYFHTDFESNKITLSNSDLYCKYLGNGEYVFINENDPKTSSCTWNHWYQVVER